MMASEEGTAVTVEALVAGIEAWLGHKHTGYDFVKVGKLMAAVDTARFIRDALPKATVFPSRNHLHVAALRARTIPGLVLEFGVAGGRSVNFIANHVPDETVHGFDSFEGLPEDWTSLYKKGHFAQPLPEVRANVALVKGLFDASLPDFLATHPGDVSYLHIDCDLYSSTRVVLDLLRERIKPGTVIVFDEYLNYPTWREHEHKAFSEFVAAHGLKFHYLGVVSCNKQLAVVVDAIG